MNRCVNASVLAVLALSACNPAPAPVSYFQPMATETQDSTAYLLPLTPAADEGRANQAGDAARLAELQGNVSFVKYRMVDRYSAFMLSGDLGTGTPYGGANFETLQLPASPPPDASGERPERTVNLMDFHPEKWTSFRVYNRGACSTMEDWPSVAQGIGDAVADQLNEDDRITNASVTEGLMSVMLRSEFHDAIGAPDDRDRLSVRTGVHIDRLQAAHRTDCRDLTFDIHFSVELQHTDRMQLPVEDRAFAIACRLGEQLSNYNRRISDAQPACQLPELTDPFWLNPDQTRPAIADVLRVCGSYAAAGSFPQEVRAATADIESDLAHGRTVVCDSDARIVFPLSTSDWTLRRHRELSGRGASDDTLLLLGLETIDGHDLGAHDTLSRVVSVSVENFHDGPNGNCNPGPVSHIRKRNIINTIKGSLRNSLPLALNSAFMAAAVQDPGVADADSQSWRLCSTDADCDFRAPDGPSFQGPDGQWRGARHVCRLSPDVDACTAHGAPADCNFCAAQLEIDRINVRPDGLEAVVEDDIDLDVDPQDPQASFAVFTDFLSRSQTCDTTTVDSSGVVTFHARPGGGYMTAATPLAILSQRTFSFPISPSSGSVGGATVPITSDGR